MAKFRDSNYYITGFEVHKWDSKNNQWSKIMDYPKCFKENFAAITSNKNKQTIYTSLSDYNEVPYAINLNTKQCQEISNIQPDLIDVIHCMIHIDNEIHLFGGNGHFFFRDGKHIIWNEETKQTEQISQFGELPIQGANLSDACFVYIKRNKCIISVGMEKGAIHEFSMIDKKWVKWKVCLPMQLTGIAAVTTRYNQYLIILGGIEWIGGTGWWKDTIFIYDFKKNIIIESDIKCPKQAQFHAVITNDMIHDNLLTFGFVADSYKGSDFCNLLKLPHYLIELTAKWVCNQEIHLVTVCSAYGRGNGEHWKINADVILQSV
eukprot:458545_1